MVVLQFLPLLAVNYQRLTTIVSIGNGWHDYEGNSWVVANNGGWKLATVTWWHNNVDVSDMVMSTELVPATTMSARAEVTVKARLSTQERVCNSSSSRNGDGDEGDGDGIGDGNDNGNGNGDGDDVDCDGDIDCDGDGNVGGGGGGDGNNGNNSKDRGDVD